MTVATSSLRDTSISEYFSGTLGFPRPPIAEFIVTGGWSRAIPGPVVILSFRHVGSQPDTPQMENPALEQPGAAQTTQHNGVINRDIKPGQHGVSPGAPDGEADGFQRRAQYRTGTAARYRHHCVHGPGAFRSRPADFAADGYFRARLSPVPAVVGAVPVQPSVAATLSSDNPYRPSNAAINSSSASSPFGIQVLLHVTSQVPSPRSATAISAM